MTKAPRPKPNRYVSRDDIPSGLGYDDCNLKNPLSISVQREVSISYRAFDEMGIPEKEWLKMLYLSRLPPAGIGEKGA